MTSSILTNFRNMLKPITNPPLQPSTIKLIFNKSLPSFPPGVGSSLQLFPNKTGTTTIDNVFLHKLNVGTDSTCTTSPILPICTSNTRLNNATSLSTYITSIIIGPQTKGTFHFSTTDSTRTATEQFNNSTNENLTKTIDEIRTTIINDFKNKNPAIDPPIYFFAGIQFSPNTSTSPEESITSEPNSSETKTTIEPFDNNFTNLIPVSYNIFIIFLTIIILIFILAYLCK